MVGRGGLHPCIPLLQPCTFPWRNTEPPCLQSMPQLHRSSLWQPRQPFCPWHEAGSHHRNPTQHHDQDLLSCLCTLGAGTFLEAGEGLAALQGLFGDHRGLGSLSWPATEHCQVSLYVCLLGLIVTPAVPPPNLNFPSALPSLAVTSPGCYGKRFCQHKDAVQWDQCWSCSHMQGWNALLWHD